jgi:hypothetical protein
MRIVLHGVLRGYLNFFLREHYKVRRGSKGIQTKDKSDGVSIHFRVMEIL